MAKAPAAAYLTVTAMVAVFALCVSTPVRAESAAHPPPTDTHSGDTAEAGHAPAADHQPAAGDGAHGHSPAPVEDHAAPSADAHAAPSQDAHAAPSDVAEGHEGATPPAAAAEGHEAEKPIAEGVTAEAEGSAPQDGADRMETLEPYQLVRSLQFVQDAVVAGDHSAMEMQRYLLGVIDERLRAADQRVFDDPRNVDAALVYAMSGGNPATLDLLAIRDRFGNFDSEVTTVLRAYLDGRAATTKTSLADLVKLYRNETIAPYLTLIAANVTAGMNEDASLELFDWARLTAPGTLVEESALRRSLLISAKKGLIEKAVHYASLYARRFINSPYAGQYADLLVDLVVSHHEAMGTEKLDHVLSFMDAPRQREVYLRISRRAAIAGNKELALFAASRAEALSDAGDPAPAILANFYSSLADVTSGNVDEVARALDGISDDTLSARDAALKNVARLVAEEVMRAPDPNSLTQALEPSVEEGAQTPADAAAQSASPARAGEAAPADKAEPAADAAAPAPAVAAAEQTPEAAAETEFQGYLDGNRKIIEEIDSLLDPKDEAKGS